MATIAHAKNARVYYDWWKVGEFANATNLDITRDAAETTAFEDAGKTFVGGKYGAAGGFAGFLDLADDGFDEVQFADINDGEHLILRCLQGTTQGYPAYETNELSTGSSRAADIGNVAQLTWNGQASDRIVRGVVLTSGEQAVTTTGNTTGVEVGAASSTQTMVVTARVLAVSGAGSITLKVQGSSDNGAGDAYAQVTGWTLSEADPGTNVNIASADEITFTGKGVGRFTRTGATEAWLRINVSAFSGFTSVTLLVTAGVKA